ncbi:MAG TPA: hypothetical protein VG755_16475 [Nannocystaceae bacterium]|nr:hypothetical protein [Nannocystaceae bacterium]
MLRPSIPCAIALGFIAAGPSCGEKFFECNDDVQCRIDALQGECHSGYCSYPDEECPSGLRFHASAPDGIANACVMPGADGTASESGGGVCGDGIVTDDEDCDDANEKDGDGCNRDCNVSGEQVWEQIVAGDGDARGRRLALGSSDEIVVVGAAGVASNGANIFVGKYSEDGESLWSQQPGTSSDDEAWAVQISDNDVIVVGGYVSNAGTGRDFWLASYDADGDERWQYDLDAATLDPDAIAPSDDEVRGLLFSPPRGIVAVGKSTYGGSDQRFAARGTIDAMGIELTSWQLDDGEEPAENDALSDVALIGQSFVVAGRRTNEAGGAQEPWLGWFDGNGMQTMEATVDPPAEYAGDDAELLQIWPTADAIYFAASVGGFGSAVDGYYGAVTLGGLPDWSRTHDDAQADIAHAITLDTEGNVIIVGETGGDTMWIIKLAPDLSELWSDTHDGVAYDVVADSQNQIIVTGAVAGEGLDLFVRKYRP